MIDPLNDITKIEDHPEYSRDNFMESLVYFGTYVKFILAIERAVDSSRIKFLPSFIGINTAGKLGINVPPEVNEFRSINIQTPGLSVEEIDKIEEQLIDLCDDIRYTDDKITFILK